MTLEYYDLEHLTIKGSMSTIKYPRGPNVGPFCSTTSYFQETKLLTTRPMDLGSLLYSLLAMSPYYSYIGEVTIPNFDTEGRIPLVRQDMQ